jgi:phosphatidate cytidylyltransferase
MKRVLTAFVLAPPLWALVRFAPAWAFSLTVGLVIAGAAWEAYGILAARGARPLRWLGLACALVVAATFDTSTPFQLSLEMSLTFATIAIAITAMSARDNPADMLETIQATLLPVLVVGLTLAHLIGLRSIGDEAGRDLLFLLFLCVMLADSAAYYVGSAIGRHKMAPLLSPKKSWEGAIAAVVGSIGAAWLARVWFYPELPLKHALIVGALLGPAGVLGDLVESVFKRAAGVKDSGRLLPGHGGLLDRTDSLLFAAPVLYYYSMIFLHGAS